MAVKIESHVVEGGGLSESRRDVRLDLLAVIARDQGSRVVEQQCDPESELQTTMHE
jgi:hypothetical protein